MKLNDKRLSNSKSKVKKLQFDNKQNNFMEINRGNDRINSKQNKQNYSFKDTNKTGIQIRNRIKNKQNKPLIKNSQQKISPIINQQDKDNVFNINSKSMMISSKKLPCRKNNQLLQKFNRKVQQRKQLPFLNTKLSRTSSTQSIKSVTFSLDSNCSNNSKNSQISSGHKNKSILKNKISSKNQSSSSYIMGSQKKSLVSSISSSKVLQQCVDNDFSNNLILERYDKLFFQVKQTNQKYTDPIYPPYEQSIYYKNKSMYQLLKKLDSDGLKIKWMRIGDYFNQLQKQNQHLNKNGKNNQYDSIVNKNYKPKLCVWSTSQKSIISKGFISINPNKQSNNNDNDYLSVVFNAISNKNYLMQKIFQNQQINHQGIYYVKIHQTQTNSWKFMIIDDFIPVIVSNQINNQNINKNYEKVIKPAFLNVDLSQNGNVIQIWPYLLQKAYAKYYSTYDALAKGRVMDFLQEITGSFYKTIQLTQNSTFSNKKQIQQIIKNPFNIVFIQNQRSKQLKLLTKCQNSRMYFLNKNEFKGTRRERQIYLSINQFFNSNLKIHYIEACKYSHKINNSIKGESFYSNSKQNSNQSPSSYQQQSSIILKSFKLSQSTNCTLALIQKQQRFQRKYRNVQNKNLKYQYSWIRVILVMKQLNGYRWINGQYKKLKTMKMNLHLQQGQYFIIILPEWKFKPYDLNLALYSNVQTVIEHKSLIQHPKIIEQSCIDISQRQGKLLQINQNICSYNFIDYKIGFIIENINNQKSFGDVKILRTIDGLDQFNIRPVNKQFGQQKKLEITIKALDSYTVVLKTENGVDKQFLEQFDFGS